MSARRLAFPLCIAALAALVGTAVAHAGTSPFGVATPDSQSGLADAGPFTGILYWAMQMQATFYRQLTAALSAFAGSSSASVWLVALSFAYGIFHAVGPGHGKAVISSYLVATGDSRRRGVALAFAAGLVQALSAIVIVTVASIVFSVTAVTMTRWTDGVEVASYGLIAALGLAMIVRKGRDALRLMRIAPVTDSGFACREVPFGATSMADLPASPRHGVDCACVTAMELARTGGAATTTQIAAAVASIGMRPCSGALIVLVFALSQDLYPVGIVSVLAMAAGTGLTVAAVAALTGTARDWISRVARSDNAWSARLSALVQLGAAALVFLFGAMMTTGALAAGGVIPL